MDKPALKSVQDFQIHPHEVVSCLIGNNLKKTEKLESIDPNNNIEFIIEV